MVQEWQARKLQLYNYSVTCFVQNMSHSRPTPTIDWQFAWREKNNEKKYVIFEIKHDKFLILFFYSTSITTHPTPPLPRPHPQLPKTNVHCGGNFLVYFIYQLSTIICDTLGAFLWANPRLILESKHGFCTINSLIKDHLDHDASKEAKNPCSEWILRFLWYTTIKGSWIDLFSKETQNPFLVLGIQS